MTALPQVLTGNFTFLPVDVPDLSKCDKKQIRNYFVNAYDINESLFSCLASEDGFYKCPDSLRLPLIFYYGHTAAVYMNKMILANLIRTEERVNFQFETIFETGVDEMSWDDLEHYRMGNKYIWPSVYEVVQFRKKVKDLILKVIERTPLQLPINFESAWWALLMGIEHERIHIETSSVLIRQMPIGLVKSPSVWKHGPTGGQRLSNEFVKVSGRTVTLGKPVDHPTFGWDNEYGHIIMRIHDFEASKYLVTNEEFLEFVNDDGYKRKQFWSSSGWSWLTYQQANHPTFWVCNRGCKSRCGADLRQYSHCEPSINDDTFKLRCLFDVIDMPVNWPVEVNYYEAKAFCAWKGREYRLLAEAEHAALRNENDPNAVTNVQFLYGSSTPVDFFPPNKLGLHDVSGNVWCWLEDHLNGFPGFQTNYLYDDFTTPCFDGLHTAIAGGSWATNGFHVGKFSRFSFRRHFFQHLGFRMVKQKFDNSAKLPIKLIRATDISITNVDCPFDEKELNDLCIQEDSKNLQFLLETPESLKRALADDAPSGLNDFCLRECLKVIRRHFVPNETLLHIGCGTGGLAFGMKKYFKKVVGIDLFRSNIEICMKINGARDEKWSKNELTFKQITWIPNELSNQNVVIFSMSERVANLKAWSRRMPEVVGKCGILFSVSRGTRHIFEDDELSMSKFVLVDDSLHEFENQTIRFTAWRK